MWGRFSSTHVVREYVQAVPSGVMRLHSDTSANARKVQDEILKRLTPEERLQMVRDLTIGVQDLAFAAIRQAKPQLTDDEIWLELAARRLGWDLVNRIYGRGCGA